jgi:hypothetical protein
MFLGSRPAMTLYARGKRVYSVNVSVSPIGRLELLGASRWHEG